MQHSMFNVAFDRCSGSAKTRALYLPRGGTGNTCFFITRGCPAGDHLSGGTARSTGEYYVYRTRPAAPRRDPGSKKDHPAGASRQLPSIFSPALLKDIGLEGKENSRSPTSVSGSFKPVSGSGTE